ncbi:MAG TPA: glycosyltransferase family 4 protein [Solirubrobacterales bacterium]|nr:glycosyltransferase family 4 protein [Solirubrobacterales bacterium]
MRIAYLTTRYPSVSHTFILREVEALRSLGFEVETFSVWRTARADLLSAADRRAFDSTYALLPPRLRDYLRAHLDALGASPWQYLRNLLASSKFAEPGLRGRLLPLLWAMQAIVLWQRCRDAGVEHVHVHFAGAPPAVAGLAARFARRSGRAGGPRSWSATVHGPVEFHDRRLGEKLAGASGVVCISDFARSQVMTRLGEREWGKLDVVRCGLDIAAFDARRNGAVAVEPGAGPLKLLCVGRLISLKGQAILLEATAELLARGLDVRLTVVGDGPKRQALESRCRELGLSERVEWTGAVGQEEIPGHYAAADVFCLPSFAEGVPTVLMEAMLTETPVVSTRIAGVSELVDDGAGGVLIPPGRVDSLVASIERLAADPALRKRLGAAGRSKVEAEFDAARSARRLAELFETYARA